jgi:copper(I)-binding protein
MVKRSIRVIVICAIVALSFAGCGSTGPSVQDAWSFATKSGDNFGVFMVVKNPGSQDDALVRAETTVSSRAELHTMVADPQGGMKMQQVESITVPAGGQVELKKGGLHVMVFAVNKTLNAGDKFPLTVHTKSGKAIQVQVTVKPQA